MRPCLTSSPLPLLLIPHAPVTAPSKLAASYLRSEIKRSHAHSTPWALSSLSHPSGTGAWIVTIAWRTRQAHVLAIYRRCRPSRKQPRPCRPRFRHSRSPDVCKSPQGGRAPFKGVYAMQSGAGNGARASLALGTCPRSHSLTIVHVKLKEARPQAQGSPRRTRRKGWCGSFRQGPFGLRRASGERRKGKGKRKNINTRTRATQHTRHRIAW